MRIIGRTRAFIAVVACAALLTACGSGPSQMSSAAIVGDRSVELGAVQHEIQWLLDNVPEAKQAQDQRKLDAESRKIVQGRVIHELVSVAAQREGLRTDERQVAELIDGSGGLEQAAKAVQVEPGRVRDVASDQVLLQDLGRRYLDRLSVALVGTVITEEQPGNTAKDQALELGRKIAAEPARAAEIVQQSGQRLVDEKERLSLGAEAQNGSEIASSAVFGAKEGTVLVIQPSQQQAGWLVALVKDRSTEQVPGGDPGFGQQADPRLLYTIGVRMLQPIADELGVRVNPRYGVWDATAMSLAANENEITGFQLMPRTVQP
ncbi:hypothetical protein CFN78_08385 [Amycolatopsis antarctica]|uniref:SurA N-terminal domain-containing protein n=1 Tax=Amycolatopsis antarctica TaxID=1854586 RepID=A0A263D679_9PSEU|nr:hypothetical protein [Amycolatopsis antarctica]OZM73548.1 hypothetical protein CFN78_08385 [Amycolatopsis antarctica]